MLCDEWTDWVSDPTVWSSGIVPVPSDRLIGVVSSEELPPVGVAVVTDVNADGAVTAEAGVEGAPMLGVPTGDGNSLVFGFGTNIVFLTSRLPRAPLCALFSMDDGACILSWLAVLFRASCAALSSSGIG